MNQPKEHPQPNYVLKANERVLVPKNEKLRKIRKAYWVILFVIIVGSFVFQDNLFSELGFTAQVLLVVIGIWLFVYGGKKWYHPRLKSNFTMTTWLFIVKEFAITKMFVEKNTISFITKTLQNVSIEPYPKRSTFSVEKKYYVTDTTKTKV